jgi:membrane protease YdiL (CAAX protease family)
MDKKNKKALIGLILFLGYPFLLKLLPLDLILHEAAMWLLLVFMILWIYIVERRSIKSVGWKGLNVKTSLIATGFGLILFVIFGVITTIIQTIGLELNQETAELIAGQPAFFLILIALRAGVVEELLYRAYAYERIKALTKSKFLAGFVPLIIFTLAHLSWGVGHLLFVFIAGGLFTIMYAVKRNLALNIIAHFTVDIIALIVLPMFLGS